MCERLINSVDFSASIKNPGNKIFIKLGMKIWKIIVKISSAKKSKEKIFRTKNFSSLSVFLSCSFSMKIGTNAELKAPSAKTRRKKFGNLKAAKKASDNMLTPKYRAIKMSRINPRIRDREMKKEMVNIERNKGF